MISALRAFSTGNSESGSRLPGALKRRRSPSTTKRTCEDQRRPRSLHSAAMTQALPVRRPSWKLQIVRPALARSAVIVAGM